MSAIVTGLATLLRASYLDAVPSTEEADAWRQLAVDVGREYDSLRAQLAAMTERAERAEARVADLLKTLEWTMEAHAPCDTGDHSKDAPSPVPTGIGDSGVDPIPDDACVRTLSPLRLMLVTFKDGDRWAGEVHGYTADVETGTPTRIRTRGYFAASPTAEDIHGLATTWFDHEIREQLGMNPHAQPQAHAPAPAKDALSEAVIEAARRIVEHDERARAGGPLGFEEGYRLRSELRDALAALDRARNGSGK